MKISFDFLSKFYDLFSRAPLWCFVVIRRVRVPDYEIMIYIRIIICNIQFILILEFVID